MRIIFAACLFALISGCNTMPIAQDNQPNVKLTENEGIIFGTFTRDHLIYEYHSQFFYFRNDKTLKDYMIKSSSENFLIGKAPVDYVRPDGKSQGVLFTFKLPAGDYHFYNFRLFHSTGHFHSDFSSREDFFIPFKVTANKATYVGDFKLTPRMGKNVFGMSIPSGGYWEIRNNKINDIGKFVAKYPNVDWSGNLSAVPAETDINTPLVSYKP